MIANGSKTSEFKRNKQIAFVKQIAPIRPKWKQIKTTKAIANEISNSLTS
jgi:hypothetical protein